jgi:3-oxoadipate enol-lactonase
MDTLLNGALVHSIDQGNSNGIPLIFIHGFPFNHTLWLPQLEALPETVHAVAYDIRGHGASGLGDGPSTVEFFVDDLIALFDQYALPQAIVCGLSMGGYIAQRFYERYPERVQGMILCDTKSEADTDTEKIKRSESIRTIRQNGVPAFAEPFLKFVFSQNSFQHHPEWVETIRRMILSNSPDGICSTALALAARTDTTQSLASITVPTLVMTGEDDLGAPPRAMKTLADQIPNAEFHLIPQAAHLTNIENTKTFNFQMMEFLRKHWNI